MQRVNGFLSSLTVDTYVFDVCISGVRHIYTSDTNVLVLKYSDKIDYINPEYEEKIKLLVDWARQYGGAYGLNDISPTKNQEQLSSLAGMEVLEKCGYGHPPMRFILTADTNELLIQYSFKIWYINSKYESKIAPLIEWIKGVMI